MKLVASAAGFIGMLSFWQLRFSNLSIHLKKMQWDTSDIGTGTFGSKQEWTLQENIDDESVLCSGIASAHYPHCIPKVAERFENVALLGNFNYVGLPIETVIFWVEKWRTVFDTILVRGPFNETQLADLRSHGIDAGHGYHGGEGPSYGFYGPIVNLKDALLQFHSSEKIKGVLYMHDDALPDLHMLSQEPFQFPGDHIIGTDLGKAGVRPTDMSYKDPRFPDFGVEVASKTSYRIYPNGTVSDLTGQRFFQKFVDLHKSVLDKWNMRPTGRCGLGQVKFTMDDQSTKYREPDDYMVFPSYTQADFLYVPTKHAIEFAELSDLLVGHGVWLECAISTIVDQLRSKFNASVLVTPLCTSWGGARGKRQMIDECISKAGGKLKYGVFHPYKLSGNFSRWEETFDMLYNSTGIQ